MKTLLLSCLVAISVISGCGQHDQEPADLATEYKNFVSFTLDSTEWTATSDGSLSVIDEVITAEIGDEPTKRTLMLTAWNVKKGATSSISLYVDSLVVGQKLDLDGKLGRASYTSKIASDAKPVFVTSDAQHTGSVTLATIDTMARRVTGTFECKLGAYTITNGKFDTRYTAPKPM